MRDTPRDDVGQKAGEGAFLPLGVLRGDAVTNAIRGGFVQPFCAQGAVPFGAFQAAGHCEDQFRCARRADHHADAFFAGVGELSAKGIFQNLLGDQ